MLQESLCRRWIASRIHGGIACCLILLTQTGSPVLAAPKLSVPKTEVSIGKLISGETGEAEFVIENAGTEPLEIQGVATSCGCTTTSFPKSLAPGEKGAIKAQLTSNPLWSGRVQKEITVTSSDPDQPTMKLHLAAEMQPLFDFSPANPIVADYKKGDVIRRVITVSTAADLAVKVTGIGSTTEGATAQLLPREPSDPPSLARIEVTIHPPALGGDVSSHIALQTSHATVTSVPLFVHLNSLDAITVRPPAVYWTRSAVDPNAEASRFIALTKRSARFRVLSTTTEHAGLHAEILGPDGEPRTTKAGAGSTEESDNIHQIALRSTGGLTKGVYIGKLLITTDDPDSPKIEVPYQVTIE